MRKAEWMDQAAIREYLEQSDPEDWKEILGKLLLTPHFRNRELEDHFNFDLARSHIRFFMLIFRLKITITVGLHIQVHRNNHG